MSDEPEVLEKDSEEAQIAEIEPPAAEEAVAEPSLDNDAQSGQSQEEGEVPTAEEEPPDETAVEASSEDDTQQALSEEDESPAAEVEPSDEEPAAVGEDGETEEEPRRQEGRHWYVIHSYSGYENKVKKNLESRIESMGMQDYIFEVVVPTEGVVELRDGRRRTVEQRIFPGYILVDMILNDESWFAVRNTPGVTGFVGSGNQPTPLRQEEVDSILRRMEEEAPKVKVSFRVGDSVRIVDGPFADFLGTVDDLNLEKGKVRLLVSFFGRETPVELDFLQVQTE
jgi:transcriptional antiterminator NusG